MRRSRIPNRLPGPDERNDTPGMSAALRGIDSRTGPPSEDDSPPVSTFPMTPAARWAVRLWARRGRGEAEDDQLPLIPPEGAP